MPVATSPVNARRGSPRRRLTAAAGRVLLLAGGDTVDDALARQLRAAGRNLVIVSRGPLEAPPLGGETRVAADIAGHGWQAWCDGCSDAVLVLPVTAFDLIRAGRPSMAHVHAARAVEACRTMGIEHLACVSVVGAAADAPHPDLRAAHGAETLIRGLVDTRWTIVRRTACFGPGDSFSAAILRHVRGFGPVAVPHPAGMVQPVAADDVAAAAVTALAADSDGTTSEVGGTERLSVEELVRRTMRAVGVHKPVVRIAPRTLRALLPLTNRLGLTALSREQLAVMAVDSVAADGGNGGAAATRARYAGPTWLAERQHRTG